ncbi:MAG: bacteriohemerythrin [Desulfovibrio sp.]
MQRIEWNLELEVGIGLLDAQHMNMVNLINQLGDAIEEGRGGPVASEVLDQLKLYTSYHFTSEERLLRIHNYPALEEHKREHAEFTDEVEDFSLDLRTGVPGVDAALHDYLCQWFVVHVQSSDQRYAKFLRGKGER